MEIGSEEWQASMDRVIRETREIFRYDSLKRLKEMDADMEAAEAGGSGSLPLDRIRAHIHAMRGVALTLGYRGVHQLCQQLSEALLQGESNWKEARVLVGLIRAQLENTEGETGDG